MKVLSKEKAIKSVMPMVKSVVNKFMSKFSNGVAQSDDLRQDLMQEGILGILEAYDKYDPNRNTKFSSFAYFFIFSRVQRCVALMFGCLRMPHTKISNDYYAVSVGRDVFDETMSEKEDVLKTYNSFEKYYESIESDMYEGLKRLTPAQSYFLQKDHNLDPTGGGFPKLEPLGSFLSKTGLMKIKRVLK